MAPRGSRPALLLPLALLVACLALASGHFPNPKYKKFLWEHWDYPKSPPKNPDAYCNKMMKERGIPEKPVHIFIHNDTQKINYVCSGGGKGIGGDWFESKTFFSITQCTWKPPKGPYSGKSMSTKIILRCWCKVPVDILECIKLSSSGQKADEEQCESFESWSVPSDQYMATDSSSGYERWAEDSDYPSPPPSAAFSAHCGE